MTELNELILQLKSLATVLKQVHALGRFEIIDVLSRLPELLRLQDEIYRDILIDAIELAVDALDVAVECREVVDTDLAASLIRSLTDM